MTSTEFKMAHPEFHAKLTARGVDFDKLHANLAGAGFNWSQILQIIQAIIAAVAPLVPTA